MVIADLISEVQYMRVGRKTTICLITLDNGYEIVGTSACVNPNEYDYELGKKYAKEDAVSKMSDIEGFILQEHFHIAEKRMEDK